jgi:hypothetical protein
VTKLSRPVRADWAEEWSVQYRTNSGGRFDRIITADHRNNAYTEASARAQAAKFNEGKKPENQCRAAKRMVTKWEAQ